MNNYVIIILLSFAAFFQLVVGVYVYVFGHLLSAKKFISAKYFGQVNVAVFTWIVWQSIYIFYVIDIDIAWVIHIVRIFFWVPVLTIPYWMCLFVLSFYNRRKDYSQFSFLRWPLYPLFALVVVPEYGLFEWGVADSYRIGSLAFWVYVMYMVVYLGLIFTILSYRYIRVHSYRIRKQMLEVGLSLAVVFFGGYMSNIILGVVIGEVGRFTYLGPIFTLIVSITITRLIIQKQLFDIPQKISNILYLISITYAIIFLRIYFVFQEGGSTILLDIGIMAAFALFYTFLLWELYTGIVQERELSQKHQILADLVASKNDFLRSATHQLRTPLTVIIGYLSDLVNRDNSEYAMTDDAYKGLQKTLISAKNLNTIINDLVATNDINGGKFGINIHDTVDLYELIQDILTDKQDILNEKNTQIHFESDAQEYVALVDQAKVREALNNIVDNAIFYGNGEIWITLSAGNLTMYTISIRDNGIGIKPEEMKKIWRKFERGERSPRVNPNGSGLGLYLAKMIMQKHGGDLVGTSQGEGEGSEFTFTIPKDTKSLAPAESFGAQVQSRGGL